MYKYIQKNNRHEMQTKVGQVQVHAALPWHISSYVKRIRIGENALFPSPSEMRCRCLDAYVG